MPLAINRRIDCNKRKDRISLISESLGTKQCSVCLEDIKNRCVTNSCRHEFCFKCLKKWSKEKNYCPLCRTVYSQIIHNIRSDKEFNVFEVKIEENSDEEISNDRRSPATVQLEINIPNRSSTTPYFLRTRIRRPNIYGNTVSDYLSRRHSSSSAESDESSGINRSYDTIV
jgi:hypothetical protein